MFYRLPLPLSLESWIFRSTEPKYGGEAEPASWPCHTAHSLFLFLILAQSIPAMPGASCACGHLATLAYMPRLYLPLPYPLHFALASMFLGRTYLSRGPSSQSMVAGIWGSGAL